MRSNNESDAGTANHCAADAVVGELVGFLRMPCGENFAVGSTPRYDATTLGSGNAMGLRKEDADLQR